MFAWNHLRGRHHLTIKVDNVCNIPYIVCRQCQCFSAELTLVKKYHGWSLPCGYKVYHSVTLSQFVVHRQISDSSGSLQPNICTLIIDWAFYTVTTTMPLYENYPSLRLTLSPFKEWSFFKWYPWKSIRYSDYSKTNFNTLTTIQCFSCSSYVKMLNCLEDAVVPRHKHWLSISNYWHIKSCSIFPVKFYWNISSFLDVNLINLYVCMCDMSIKDATEMQKRYLL